MLLCNITKLPLTSFGPPRREFNSFYEQKKLPPTLVGLPSKEVNSFSLISKISIYTIKIYW